VWTIRNATYVRSGEAQARTGFANCRSGAGGSPTIAVCQPQLCAKLLRILRYPVYAVASELHEREAGIDAGETVHASSGFVRSIRPDSIQLDAEFGGRPAAGPRTPITTVRSFLSTFATSGASRVMIVIRSSSRYPWPGRAKVAESEACPGRARRITFQGSGAASRSSAFTTWNQRFTARPSNAKVAPLRGGKGDP
jgi:hypothetical protein